MLSTAFLLSYDLRQRKGAAQLASDELHWTYGRRRYLRPPQRRSSSRLNRRRSRADLNASRRHLDHEQPYTSRKNLIDQSCAPGGLTGRSEGQQSHFGRIYGFTRNGTRRGARRRKQPVADRDRAHWVRAPCRVGLDVAYRRRVETAPYLPTLRPPVALWRRTYLPTLWPSGQATYFRERGHVRRSGSGIASALAQTAGAN